jgi:hypothetical protein
MQGLRSRIVVPVVLFAMALGACGAEEEAEDALDRAGFVARGNEICARTEERIREGADKLFAQDGKIPPMDDVQKFALETVAPAVDDQLRQLAELKPSPDDRQRVRELIEEGRNAVTQVRRDPTIIISEPGNPFRRYDRMAADFGLNVCAEASSNTRQLMSGIRGG